MTAEHDAVRGLVAPVALGAADEDETARVEAHARECAVCREDLAALRGAAGMLAVSVPQRDPSPDLKASLMATVRAEAPVRASAAGIGAPAPAAPAAPRPRRSWLGSLRPWPAVAALATLVALLLAWNIALQTGGGSDRQEVRTLAVAGTVDAPGTLTGRIVYVPGEGTAIVRISGLPPLEPDEAYQLWILRDGRPAMSAGLFEQTGPADARSVAGGLADGDALAVTAQPRANRTTPQGPVLMQAALGSS